jgi:hypothetical protein
MVWLVTTIVCVAVGLLFYFRIGPGFAVGAGMAVALLAPTWIVAPIDVFPMDARSATAAALMIVYCFHPAGKVWSRIGACDLAISGLVITHVASDWFNSGFDWVVPFRAYGEWALPYIAGRFALMHVNSIAFLNIWFATVAIAIGVPALAEALTSVNLWEVVFGPVDDLVARIRLPRYNFVYRAIGPTRHPIFLGIVCMLLVPWAVSLIDSEQRRRLRGLGWAALVAIVIGVASTVSRGPLLGLVVAAACMAAFYSVWARRSFAGLVVAGLLVVMFAGPQVLHLLEKSESPTVRSKVVEIDGELETYTGTNNRLYAVKIYGPLAIRGGALGYGTVATSSFPPNIPGLPVAATSERLLGVVDNSFILIGLRFGLIGAGLFVLLVLGAAYTAFGLARESSLVTYPKGPLFLVALGSSIIGVSLEILTVFSSYDFVFWILFACGAAAGLKALDYKIRSGEVAVD